VAFVYVCDTKKAGHWTIKKVSFYHILIINKLLYLVTYVNTDKCCHL